MKKNTSKETTKRTLLIILCVILAVFLIVLVVGTAFVERWMGLIGRNNDDGTLSPSEYEEFINSETETMDPNFTGEILDPGDVEWDIHDGPVEEKEHIINIMLIGQDRRPGESRTRSDVMILCTVNKNTQELTMTSFMRDMYVPIPGYEDNRINICYVFGGMELLDACLETNFGVHIDGNVEVDFNGFVGLIDLIDGIELELSESEAAYMRQLGHADVHSGMNLLGGEEALTYARNRTVGDGDFTRTERQRKVIGAVLEKCKEMNLSQLKDLMEAALPMLTTDMNNREILNYLLDILPLLTNLKVNTQRIPADGTYQYAWIRDMSVLLPDLSANRELLAAAMAE